MTLASDPFGLIHSAGQQARPAVAVRNAGAELWRGFQRLCTVVRREQDQPLTMAEKSWQAGFASMWDQHEVVEDHPDNRPANRGGLEFL